ncbi:MAG: methyltransferase domain-containing protein [Pseudomonadota bacterium]
MDLFGEALRDWEAGKRGRMLTIRRDDDHTDAHDPGLYFAEVPFAHETDLLAQARGPVLDVGCGAGRTLLWLERHGIEATGIDLSPGAVEVARSRGCKDVRHGDVLAEGSDMLIRDAFQTIILFGNNMGIGGTIEGAADLLRRIAHMTRPGGQLLVTGLDVAQTETPRHLAYHSANRAKGRPHGEITMRFEYEGRIGGWVPWVHPEPHELERLARKTGWEAVEIATVSGPLFAATLRKSR